MYRRVLSFLSHGPVILTSFSLMLLIGAGFSFVMGAIDGPLLDMIFTGEAAMTRLGELRPDQRMTHFYATVFLDTLYPLAYGGFLIGWLARFGGPCRGYTVLPAIVTVLADFSENIVQAVALAGAAPEILAAKTLLTPLKMTGLGSAFLLGLSLALIHYLLVYRKTRKTL